MMTLSEHLAPAAMMIVKMIKVMFIQDCAISHASEEAESLASAEVLWRLTERELGIS